ncbi:MAG: G1 family glutamic endopeptidase [Capsulimonadaceae bacterium]
MYAYQSSPPAEWIIEAPTVNNGQSQIADYAEVFFSTAQAVTNKGVSEGILIAPMVVQCLYTGGVA